MRWSRNLGATPRLGVSNYVRVKMDPKVVAKQELWKGRPAELQVEVAALTNLTSSMREIEALEKINDLHPVLKAGLLKPKQTVPEGWTVEARKKFLQEEMGQSRYLPELGAIWKSKL